ncbi:MULTISPECIES: ABC transporter substrate-binding protein [unclassified Variovorax]|uniref:ABC transporter substrate-binding protein n=1 Tax=unclassified Variovorax TaxID=663243 RepID=UPI0008924B0B|nr:ABC transporter substrate-binding protein [Variovorax sp. CF079]SDC91308.1 putative spermidine/putrescine transport system substrate-binding protein [Variovorax sp. CF079]
MLALQNRRDLLLRSLGAAAGLALPALSSFAAAPLVVNTYGGRWEKFWRSDLLPMLDKTSGVQPTLDVGLGKNFIANLRAAGIEKPPYSVLMVNENIASVVRGEGYFEPIPAAKVPNLANVYPNLRNPGDNGVRGIVSTIGIGYRKDLVKTPPKSWTDLWSNPEFKGKIGLYQIGNTAAMLFLLMTAKIYGGSQDAIDRAFVEIKKLLPFTQADWSGTLSTMLTRGDVTVAVIDFPEIVALKKKGVPVEMVVPSEGVVAFEQSFNILKNAPNKEDAYKYLNFILQPEVQEMMAKEFFTSPTNTKVQLASAMAADVPVSGQAMASIVGFDWSKVNPQLPAITDRWNREIK